MNRSGIPVLCVLDQKNHEECDDGSPRINDQLPGIRVVKVGAGNQPEQDYEESREEGPFCPHTVGCLCSEDVESVLIAVPSLSHKLTIDQRISRVSSKHQAVSTGSLPKTIQSRLLPRFWGPKPHTCA